MTSRWGFESSAVVSRVTASRVGASVVLSLGLACAGDDTGSGQDGSGSTTGASTGDPTGDPSGPTGTATATGSGSGESGLDTTADGTSTGPGPGTSTGTDTDTDTDTDTGEPFTALEIVVVGQTESTDFPVTPGAPEGAYLGGPMDGFVARLVLPTDGSPSTLDFATYLGGSQLEQVRDVALDDGGAIHVTGRMASPNMTTTAGVMQPAYGGGGMDGFLVRYLPDGTVDYATYVGGDNYDVSYAISVDDAGAIYLSGRTSSTNLPVTMGAYQPVYAGGTNSPPYFGGDFFGLKLEPDGSGVTWGTFAGGSADDMGRGRNFVDAQGALWIEGRTLSNDFPTTAGAVSAMRQGQSDAGIVRISADGSTLLYGTYLGGAGGTNDAATGGIAVLPNGEALICGYATAPDFPIPGSGAQPNHGGGSDGFVVRLSPDGSQILGGTFLGGSGYEECQGVAVDDAGNVYAIGLTLSDDFPTTAGAYQPGFGGATDMWAVGLSADLQTMNFGTYVGGDGQDTADSSRVWVDPEGQIVLVGNAGNGNAPVTADAAQPAFGGGPHDAYVVRLSSDGSTLLYASFLGGMGDDFARSIAVRAQP